MRIKLRNLLSLTEQAPQPPMGGDPLAPAPAPVAPPGMNAGGEDTPEAPDAAGASPTPEDPGEYDFTKDFREFEDKKNKAESEAKKALLDKMNEKLLNKTIVANASRGYGQPKTDYTIKGVKKISVEFWYKDYVVIAADENDKKYFLTPGINIKIEGDGSSPAPGDDAQAAPQGQEVGGQEQPPQPKQGGQPPEGGQESPNPASPAPAEPQGITPQAKPEPAPAPQPPAPQQEVPEKPASPPQVAPNTAPVEDPKKKKKIPVAEWVQTDLNKFLGEFMSENVKNNNGKVNFLNYVSGASKMLSEGVNSTKVKCKLMIPESHMVNVDNREIKLASIDAMRTRTPFGQYSKGSLDINKLGRYYHLEYVKEIGWNN